MPPNSKCRGPDRRGARLLAAGGSARVRRVFPPITIHQQDGAAPMSDDDNLEYRFQNLHEFVKVARQNLNRNNWDYLIGGSESETTLARNRLALDSIGFRPRVLRDVSNVDVSRE